MQVELSDATIESLLGRWPVARLASSATAGRPHQVPIVFARAGDRLWSPIDGKPKKERQSARRAEILLARSAEFFGEVEAHGLRAQALLDLGLLHKAKKRREKAKECLAEAEGLFERMGAEVFLRQTRETLAELSP